jgi:hypothetical protein
MKNSGNDFIVKLKSFEEVEIVVAQRDQRRGGR